MGFLRCVVVCMLVLPMSAAQVVHSEIFYSDTYDPLQTTAAPDMYPATTPATGSLWKLSEEGAELVLKVHNEGRRKVSPSAANMNILRWDDNLATAAQGVVDTCIYKTSRPSLLADRTYLAEVTGQQKLFGFLLEDHVSELFSLGSENKYNDRPCTAADEHCEAYKIITWGGAFRIGCAQVHCSNLEDDLTDGPGTDSIYWKCFYESEDEIQSDIPSYIVGRECSECSSGAGWCRENLCDSTCAYYMNDCTCTQICGEGLAIDAHDCICRDPAAYEKYCLGRGFPSCGQDMIRHPFTCDCFCDIGFCFIDFECVDIDECESNNGGCDHHCVNTVGSYRCDCDYGFIMNEAGECREYDECTIDNGGCAHFCIDIPGSYYCACEAGYTLALDGHFCDPTGPWPSATPGERGRLIKVETDKADCLLEANLDCEHICLNTTDGYMCDCRPGFLLADDDQACDDINECDVNNGGCEHICNNLPGSYNCSCRSGFILDFDDKHCILDVCSLGSHCNGRGYLDMDACVCICSDGYKGDECEIPCTIDETDCWHVFRERTVEYDGDYCPVFCRECACLSNFPVCINGGELKYSEDFHHCRCYCPLPMAGKSCEDCALVDCANGGVLDAETCQCNCPAGWRGLRCEESCQWDSSMMCTSLSQPYCDSLPIVAEKCPVLCGVCVPSI